MAKDIMLDENYDLLIRNGDFVVDDSEVQEAALIALSEPGDWRQWPTIGFGALRRMKGVEDKVSFVSGLKLALSADGKTPKKIDVSQGVKNFKVEM